MKRNGMRLILCCGLLLIGVAASAQKGSGGQASLTLLNCSASSCNVTNTSWALTKCDLDASGNCVPNFFSETVPTTVNWRVVATKTGISDKIVTVNGFLTIQNTGTADATIGNIVVNLQRSVKYGKNTYWVSSAADIADEQWGDLSSGPYATATSNLPACAKGNAAVRCADIVATSSAENPTVNAAVNTPANYSITNQTGTFKETAASGSLVFYDVDNNNSVFSINPAFVLAQGATKTLAYTAKFDNTILGLADGTPIRVEGLVSFGNAGARGGSGATASYIDVNGNGTTTDFGEANVRTVPCRWTSSIPATLNDNSVVDLADANNPGTATFAGSLDGAGNPIFTFGYGLVTFGTPNYGNFQTDIGGTPGVLSTANTGFETLTGSATRAASVDVFSIGDSSLEAIANCATLTEDASIFSDSCSVPVHEQACAWPTFTSNVVADNFCSVSQGGWGAKPAGFNYGNLLANNFASVYPTGVTVGGSFHMTFTTAAAIELYLPAKKTAGALTANLTNPTSTAAGVFGGQVLTLQMNVDFSAKGVLPAGFGGSTYTSATPGACEDGKTINAILADANTVLGGGSLPSSCSSISVLNDVVDSINRSFDGAPACPKQ